MLAVGSLVLSAYKSKFLTFSDSLTLLRIGVLRNRRPPLPLDSSNISSFTSTWSSKAVFHLHTAKTYFVIIKEVWRQLEKTLNWANLKWPPRSNISFKKFNVIRNSKGWLFWIEGDLKRGWKMHFSISSKWLKSLSLDAIISTWKSKRVLTN